MGTCASCKRFLATEESRNWLSAGSISWDCRFSIFSPPVRAKQRSPTAWQVTRSGVGPLAARLRAPAMTSQSLCRLRDRQRGDTPHSPACPRPHDNRSLRRADRRKRNGVVRYRASIEAANAAQAGTHVTFTQDAWEAFIASRTKNIPRNESSAGTTRIPALVSFFLSTTPSSSAISSLPLTRWRGFTIRIPMKKVASAGSTETFTASRFSLVDNNGDGVERTPKEKPAMTEPQSNAGQAKPRVPPAWVSWAPPRLTCLRRWCLALPSPSFYSPDPVGCSDQPGNRGAASGAPTERPAPQSREKQMSDPQPPLSVTLEELARTPA